YRQDTREVLVADPYKSNPLSTRYYAVGIHRLIGAILLGIMTYDANLLIVEPRRRSRSEQASITRAGSKDRR
ncbi:MAG TPA: hypothetical protein VFY39_14265, partial [Gammaproteobacteria bacterium]|nr:hypothetical protein [Gammaproteobacteria bacterium]